MNRTLPALLCAVVLISLACGGGGGGPAVPAREFEPQEEPPPALPTLADGLGAELGFPYAPDGEVSVNEATKVAVLYRSAFDAGGLWDAYAKGLEAAGWTRAPTSVPPFAGVFTRDGRRVLVTADLKGSAVWVTAEIR